MPIIGVRLLPARTFTDHVVNLELDFADLTSSLLRINDYSVRMKALLLKIDEMIKGSQMSIIFDLRCILVTHFKLIYLVTSLRIGCYS